MPRGKGFEFVNGIVGGVIPKEYIPAVQKGMEEAMQNGVVAGYPMVDMSTQMFNETHRVSADQLVIAPVNRFHRREFLVTPATSAMAAA